MTTQTQKVLSYLQSGKSINQGQAQGLFGVSSLTKVVSNLRYKGHCVYTTKNKSGTTAYRIGKPSKRMIAAAYLVMGPTIFG